MLYEKLFLKSLLITLVIEVPIVFLLVKYLFKKKINFNLIFIASIASILTLPYLWFILPAFILNKVIYIIFGEILVLLVEFVIYYFLLKLKLKQAFFIALIANLVSFSFSFLF